MSYKDVKQRALEQIVENIQKDGFLTWQKGWKVKGGLARNASTGKYYRGINQLLLAQSGFNNPYFLTMKQGNALGGRVKAGSKGTTILRGVEMTRKEVDAVDSVVGELPNKKFFVMVPWTVFNVSQFDGLDLELDLGKTPEQLQMKAPEVMDYINQKMGTKAPKVRYENKNPCYYPVSDTIVLPPITDFYSVYEFIAAYVHELGHATGHESRLHRPDIYTSRFGTPAYAREEIIVELASSMICAELGISNSEEHAKNHSAYIKHWMDEISQDSSYLFKAFADASNIFDYIIAFKQGYEPSVEEELVASKKPAYRPK